VIGWIGFGRFGRLAVRYLAADFPVRVYTPSGQDEAIAALGAEAVSFREACRQKIVVPAVPISQFRATLHRMAPLLASDTLVVDVCSVKTLPVHWMQETLPADVQVLATHPMFGPDSAAESLRGCKMVLCPQRVPPERYGRIRTYLQDAGLTVIETSAEAHDRDIAVSLGLTHFIGRALAEFGAGPLEIDTEGYKRLLHILGVVEHDTWQLFEDMHRFNPFAGKRRREFTQALGRIEARLGDKG
jgi:prephenate dehydrogenase